MTLWGAFTYYGSKSTFGLSDQCNLCVANHQDPPGTNCQDSLEGLSRNLAATVMAGIGIAYTNGWLGKRETFMFYMRAILMVLLTFLLVMISMLLIMRFLITLMITIITIYWLIRMNQNITK